MLPARVADYRPALLDEVMAAGEVLWTGHGSLAGDDGWVALHPAETAPLTIPLPAADAVAPDGELHRAVLDVLAGGGGYFFRQLADAVHAAAGPGPDGDVADALWELVFAGLVSSDTLAPLRARLTGGRTTHRPKAAPPRVRMRGPSGLAVLSGRLRAGQQGAGGMRRAVPPSVIGRWSLVPDVEPDTTVRTHAAAEVLLDRYGVLTRGAVVAEGVPGGFAAVYRVLSAMEETGRIRRGYFVEGLGAAQFARSSRTRLRLLQRLRRNTQLLQRGPTDFGGCSRSLTSPMNRQEGWISRVGAWAWCSSC